jgi:hypothetical protein
MHTGLRTIQSSLVLIRKRAIETENTCNFFRVRNRVRIPERRLEREGIVTAFLLYNFECHQNTGLCMLINTSEKWPIYVTHPLTKLVRLRITTLITIVRHVEKRWHAAFHRKACLWLTKHLSWQQPAVWLRIAEALRPYLTQYSGKCPSNRVACIDQSHLFSYSVMLRA